MGGGAAAAKEVGVGAAEAGAVEVAEKAVAVMVVDRRISTRSRLPQVCPPR